jgi:acyl-CoA thioesterase-1
MHSPGLRLLLSLMFFCAFTPACSKRADDASAAERPPAARPTEPKPASDLPKIVVLGDSLTAGLGLGEAQSFPSILQELVDEAGYKFKVVNAGVSGDTSAGGLRRVDWALDGDVRVLVLALGANDGLRGLSVREMKANLTAIIARAREKKVEVILAGMEAPPNYGQEYAAEFRNAFRDLARDERVVFIPFLLDKVAGLSAMNQADGIHPNERGARIMAETVWTALRPVLDRMTTSS